jgi:quercetin dioxygenase-like cupin family protein
MECLGTNLKDFFNEVEEEKIVFKKDDFFIQEDQELMNTVTWIVPSSQKNDMEPILLELKPGGSSQVDNPHEGEEFGYVLAGNVTVHVGKKKFKVKKGECFYYIRQTLHTS